GGDRYWLADICSPAGAVHGICICVAASAAGTGPRSHRTPPPRRHRGSARPPDSEIERRAQDKQPRIDDPISTGGAIRRSGEGLKPSALVEVSHVELD